LNVLFHSTACPTRYRTRNFFNNSNTKEYIATGRKWWPLPAHVMMSSHFLHNELSPLEYPH